MRKPKPKPKFFHGCPDCKFLGTDKPRLDEEAEANEVDMYVHSHEGHHLFWRRHGDNDDELIGLAFSSEGTSLEGLHEAWLSMIRTVSH